MKMVCLRSILYLCLLSFVLYPAFAEDTTKKPDSKASKEISLKEGLKGKEAAVGSAPKVSAAKAAFGPMATLQSNIKELKETLLKYGKRNAKTKLARDKEVRRKVRFLLDYDKLGRLALRSHWKKVSSKQRREFLRLFRSLIEKSYLAKLDNLVADYEMQWLGEEIKGTKATVKSRVIRDEADVDIVYYMEKKKGRWMVYDIVFDDLDLAKNYHSQFNKIIVEKGMNELLRKMRKKLKKKA